VKRAGIPIIVLMMSLLSVALVGAAPSAPNAGGSTATLPAYAALGVAQVGGRDVYVHVWVVPPPGASPSVVAVQALREQGARPVDPREVRSSRFTTSGLSWDQFFDLNSSNNYVVQSYNASGQPVGVDGAAAVAALQATHTTWTNVGTSRFAFAYGGSTTRCPSLVRECPGRQFYDGRNDVEFLALSGCCTLGVTWYSTSRDEADMALNTKFPWTTSGGSGYDLQTVLLHENGHVAGLGHSTVTAAVMYAYYGGVRRALHPDDICGISNLYPEAGFTGC